MSHHLRKWARRPEDFVEATRWVFAVLVLTTLVLALPAILATGAGTMSAVGLVSALVLALSLGTGYLRRSAPLGTDLLDAVALLGVALSGTDPLASLSLAMPALWFRSLYGTTSSAFLRAGLYAAALLAALFLWPFVPGHTGVMHVIPVGQVVGVIPPMFLTVIAGRQLTAGLLARAQSAQRDAVHKRVGSQLLGVTEAAEISRIGWEAMAGICAATPGLRVLKLVRDGEALRVDEATGGFAGIPATLPETVLAVQVSIAGGRDATAVQNSRDLDAAVGTVCAWVCMPLPEEHPQHGSAWLLLGSPGKVSPEAVVSVGTVENQVTLALRNGEVHQKLTQLAELDSLTGLANRASFNEGLGHALDDESLRLNTVLFVDLDDFKDVNDVLGHGAGDDLLREVAKRLCEATRPGDLCARLGGDEFAVLLHGTDSPAAADVARRIVEAVRAPVHIGAGFAHVGASIGVATATDDINLEQLVHRADVAMYAAKAKGKGRIQVFETGLLAVDSSQMIFERELAGAASKGELIVHYQPVLSLPDQRCTAVEALVRWQHPERGLLYPGAFIGDAERIGAIADIGAFVLRRACADAALWRQTQPSPDLAVHVNISALQLDDEGLIDIVIGCLREFGLPAQQLVLEVTESIVISSPVAIERLNILADYGVTIAIDDFGTGYSALTTLRSLPAQIVKIDISFVAGCPENSQDRAVVEAVVNMATQMGMRTIAEGVERPEQQAFLESIGTDAVQGYLYLRPTAAQEFGSWLGARLDQISQTQVTKDVVIPFVPRQTA